MVLEHQTSFSCCLWSYSAFQISFVHYGTTHITWRVVLDSSLKLLNNSSKKQKWTPLNTMLVFMVRGLFIDLKFPYARFATESLTADLLFPLAWEAFQNLEAADFKVIVLVCDGASQNRKFFHMHSSNSKETVYETKNPNAGEPRPIHFCSTSYQNRNCWANSIAHSNSRAMWVSSMHDYTIHAHLLYYTVCSIKCTPCINLHIP